MVASVCPCVTYARNKQRFTYLTTQGTFDPEHGGGWCSSDCWYYAMVIGLPQLILSCFACGIGAGCCGFACCLQVSLTLIRGFAYCNLLPRYIIDPTVMRTYRLLLVRRFASDMASEVVHGKTASRWFSAPPARLRRRTGSLSWRNKV